MATRWNSATIRPLGLGCGKLEVDGLLFLRNLDALHPFEFLDAALHLLGLGGRVAEAVDEHFELLDAIPLVLVGRFDLGPSLRLFLQVLLVIAGVEVNRWFQISTIFFTVTSRKKRSCEINTQAWG